MVFFKLFVFNSTLCFCKGPHAPRLFWLLRLIVLGLFCSLCASSASIIVLVDEKVVCLSGVSNCGWNVFESLTWVICQVSRKLCQEDLRTSTGAEEPCQNQVSQNVNLYFVIKLCLRFAGCKTKIFPTCIFLQPDYIIFSQDDFHDFQAKKLVNSCYKIEFRFPKLKDSPLNSRFPVLVAELQFIKLRPSNRSWRITEICW